MVLLHAHDSLSLGAHSIHYAVVGLGVLGLVAMLSPRFLAETPVPRDEHEARVRSLRAGLAGVAQADWTPRGPVLTATHRVLLPLAVVSSAAAAGVHAAVTPEHLQESLLLGLFLATAAVAQLAWAAAVAAHGSRPLLLVGACGDLALLTLWAVTRTLGLPFGLLPGPEAIGPWDLACGAWELVTAGCCLALLRSRDPLPARLPGWRHWHPALPTYVAASVLVLVAASLTGAGA